LSWFSEFLIDMLFRKSNELLGQVPFSVGDLGYALAITGARNESERILSDMVKKKGRVTTRHFPSQKFTWASATPMLRSNGSSTPSTTGTWASTCRRSIPSSMRGAASHDSRC
jgi:hypothetical protein